ncbi:hypothetical protein PQX77_003428 [Marasmius sp. AFHP31]|nr:hypothetical protein PQX77_003428 [Marasmius sp. AFHP31]
MSSHQARNHRYNPLSSRTRASRSQPANDYDVTPYDPTPEEIAVYMRELRVLLRQRPNVIWDFDPVGRSWIRWLPPLHRLKSCSYQTVPPRSYRLTPGCELPKCPHSINPYRPAAEYSMTVKDRRVVGPKTEYFFVVEHAGCFQGRMPIPWTGKEIVDEEEYRDAEEEDELDIEGTRELNARSPPCYSPPPFLNSDNTSSTFSTPQKATPLVDRSVTTPSPPEENPEMSTILFGTSVQDSSDILNEEQVAFRKAADPDFVSLASEKMAAEILSMERKVFVFPPVSIPSNIMWSELPARLQDFKSVHSGSFFLRHCSDVHTSVGGTILDLAGIPGVAPGEFNAMVSTSKTCPACSSEFSSWGFRFHLGLEGECRNSKSDYPVSFIVDNTKATDAHIHERLLNSRHILPGSLQENDAVTELVGSLYLMWNSPAGIPSDLWAFAKEGKVFCNDCFHYRTVEGHALHIDAEGSCVVAPALRDAGGKGKGKGN